MILQSLLAATAVFTQIQLKYGAQRADYLHRWYERPLHQNTAWADENDGKFLNPPAWRKTAETLKLGGMTGVAFFPANGTERHDVLRKSLMPGGETQILFELTGKGYSHTDAMERQVEVYLPLVELALKQPNYFRIDGKLVLPVRYKGETCDASFCRVLKKALVEKWGDRFILMPFGNVFEKREYAGLKTPPEVFDRAREHVRELLRAGDGFYYQGREGFEDRRFNAEAFDATVGRVVREVYAEDEFRGKKKFGSWITQGHENTYRWEYVVDSEGTRGLCARMESLLKLNPDVIGCCEWDEENENSHFRPTVANGYTTQRLMRYYVARMNGGKLAPIPGDDLSKPNLVLSYRKSVVLGDALEVEVRNAPDGSFAGETFDVAFAWLDAAGNRVKAFPAQKLASATPDAVRFTASSVAFAGHRFLQPCLVVRSSKGEQVFSSGLFPLGLHALRNVEHKWVKRAVREIAPDVAATLTVGAPDDEGVRVVSGRVSSKGTMRSVEVLDDMDTAYFHAATSETPAGFEPIRIQFNGLPFNTAKNGGTVSGSIRFVDTPGVKLKKGGARGISIGVPNAPVDPKGAVWTLKNVVCNGWGGLFWADVPTAEMDRGAVEIDLPPYFRGTVRLADLKTKEVVGLNGARGCGLSVMRDYRPQTIPRPIFTNDVAFTFRWKPLEKASVLRVQVIGEDYRIWHGATKTIAQATGVKRALHVYDRTAHQTVEAAVDEGFFEEPRFDFGASTDSAVRMGAGRALVGLTGGAATMTQGFGWGESQYGNPLFRQTKNLSLDGVPAKGWGSLPLQTVPGLAGFALTMNVKPAGFGLRQGLMGSGNCGFDLALAPDGSVVATLSTGDAFGAGRGLDVFAKGPKLKDGEWNTVRLVTDRKTVSVEVNGEKGAEVSYEDYFFNQRYTLFGASHPNGDFFKGEIRDFAVKVR